MKLEAFSHWIGRNWQWLISVHAAFVLSAEVLSTAYIGAPDATLIQMTLPRSSTWFTIEHFNIFLMLNYIIGD